MNKNYIFISKRLGFRNWKSSDIEKLHAINSDKEVMRFFPSLLTKQKTQEFIERMQKQFEENGFCYFAVEVLENQGFIGFIGIAKQTFEADFTPCIDIGWRLGKEYWKKGYANEGAKRCLEYAFSELENSKKPNQIVAIAPKINLNSIGVMKKIGMQYLRDFKHPALKETPHLETCVLYKIDEEV